VKEENTRPVRVKSTRIYNNIICEGREDNNTRNHNEIISKGSK
jgi:hypothetical protein